MKIVPARRRGHEVLRAHFAVMVPQGPGDRDFVLERRVGEGHGVKGGAFWGEIKGKFPGF